MKSTENKYIKTIKNLEFSLTETEKELCKLKEQDLEQKREIFHLESGLLKLKQQNNNFSKSFRQLKLPPNKKLLPLKMNISEENLEEKEKEKEDMDEKLLEKEKQILGIKEKMNEMEVYYQTQLASCMNEIKGLQSHGDAGDEVRLF